MTDYGSVIRGAFGREAQQGRLDAVVSIDDDPEKAARAMQLAEGTPFSPAEAYNDLDNFEREQRQAVTGSLFEGNPRLSQYVNSHPMAAKVSSDDWGQLDETSGVLSKLRFPFISASPLTVKQHLSIAGKAIQAFRESFDGSGLGKWMGKEGNQLWAVNPYSWTAYAALGAPIEIPARLFSAGLHAMHETIAESGTQLGMDPMEAKRLARDLVGIAEYQLNQTPTARLTHGTGVPRFAEATGNTIELMRGPEQQFMRQAGEAYQLVKPYIDAKKEPPAGLHPLVDEIKLKQTELDLDNVQEALGLVQKANTWARSPELMQKFVEQTVGNAEMGISAEAVAKLYGTKLPKPDDNLLGWVPNIESQMARALATGGDISVPLAEWLVRVDPEVAKQLRDDLRPRNDGITVREAEEFVQVREVIDAFHGSPHEFEAFSLEKVGTGEGAQAYGHGLYFAEKQDVAKSYARTYHLERNTPEYMADLFLRSSSSREDAITALKAEMVDAKPTSVPIYEQAIRMLGEGWQPPGQLYKVRLKAEKSQFLDWDRPIGETGIDPEAINRASGMGQPALGNMTGEEIYRVLSRVHGQKGASEVLARAGVPGLKYLDQFSRSEAEAKTSNFVVFDDTIIETVERNGEALASVREAAGLNPMYGTGPRPGWDWQPAQEPVTLHWGKAQMDVVPVTSATVKHALSQVDVSQLGLLGPHLKPIVDRILETAADMPVHVVTDADLLRLARAGGSKSSDTAGIYVPLAPGKDYIVINASTFYDASFLPRAIVHESIHAVTSRALDRIPALANGVKNLMKLLEEQNPALKEQYGYKNEHEFLAETISNKQFQELLLEIEINPKLAQALGMEEWSGKTPWRVIVEYIRDLVFNLHPEAYTALEAALRMTEKAADVQKTIQAPFRQDVPIRGIEKPEQLKAFENARSLGLTAEQYRLYQQRIAEQQAKDLEFLKAKAEQMERRKQTQEWKELEAITRSEVETDIALRPDIAVANFFRSGKLYGESSGVARPRINPKTFTPEQKAMFPQEWQRRDGMDAGDVAKLFGYPNVDAMVAHAKDLQDKMAALGETRIREYTEMLVRDEVEQKMFAHFGDLEANILKEAQEHVISPTLMDMLHEEVVGLGMKTGSAMQFSQGDMKKWAKQAFDNERAATVSVENFLRDSGRTGKLAETALLKGDFTEAFKQKQKQYLSILLANEAKTFAKEKDRFDKLFGKYEKRVVKGVDQIYADFIQDTLSRAGLQGQRTPEELRVAVGRTNTPTLESFVNSALGDGWDMIVAPELIEGRFKSIDQMTVLEYRDFAESIKSMDHIGRRINKINVAGDLRDFKEFRAEVIENIRKLPARDRATAERWFYHVDAWLARPEEIFKDLDLRQELGPLFNAVIRPLMAAKSDEFNLLKALTERLKEVRGENSKKWLKSLDDDIPNDFLTDPDNGNLFSLSREKMINIMLNFGNASNIEKFTKGYGGKEGAKGLEARLLQMFDQYATREDWQYVQNIWDIWEGWRQRSDNMYYNLSGVPPKWIEPTPIANKHGVFKGGYYPIIYDRLTSHINVIEERQPAVSDKSLFNQANYFRATPFNSYTKERTGVIMPIQFMDTLETVGTRMQQTIHDIAYREAIIDVGKIIYDKQIRQAIRKHYGMEYEKQLDPWLKDVANYYNMDEKKNSLINRFLRRTRFNLVSHALGLNLKVILSPDIGAWDPIAHGGYLRNWEKNQELVYAKSQEIPHTFRNIDRDFRERLEHTIKERGWNAIQAEASRWGFLPLVKASQLFREATFYKEYTTRIQQGMHEKDAIAVADSLVRERHGTGAVVDLPAALRGNEAMKIFTMFYGFFNTMYNWQRQMPGQMRRGEYMALAGNLYGTLLIPSLFGAVLFNKAKEDDSWFKIIAKAIPLQMLSTMPFARDAANYWLEGNTARTPWASLLSTVGDVVGDVKKYESGKRVDKGIRHAANLTGALTGLPLGQVGRTSQFLYDVGQNRQRPRDITEWIRGIIHGEARLKRK